MHPYGWYFELFGDSTFTQIQMRMCVYCTRETRRYYGLRCDRKGSIVTSLSWFVYKRPKYEHALTQRFEPTGKYYDANAAQYCLKAILFEHSDFVTQYWIIECDISLCFCFKYEKCVLYYLICVFLLPRKGILILSTISIL